MGIKNNNLNHIVIGTDANYLHKAVVFYESLKAVYKNFILHVFCFDEVSYKAFSKLSYQNVVFYHPKEFETKALMKLKSSKERAYEYYWAINAYITKFVMDKYNPKSVTFSDCDYMFFQSPELIFDETNGADILIQPNNFSYQQVKDFIPVGYYCSSFEFFRNNKNGKKALNWWHKACMEWCSASFKDGKFGDQKYLDDWRTRFNGVREVSNPGANVAPWNIQKYDLEKRGGKILINGVWPLIYYHFHSFRINLSNYKYIVTGDRHNNYEIDRKVINLVYKPYIQKIISAIKKLKKVKEYRLYIESNPEGNYHLIKSI